MPIVVRCDNCNSEYRVSEALAGKILRCKQCSAGIPVPAPQSFTSPAHAEVPTSPAEPGGSSSVLAPLHRIPGGSDNPYELAEEASEPPVRPWLPEFVSQKLLPLALVAGGYGLTLAMLANHFRVPAPDPVQVSVLLAAAILFLLVGPLALKKGLESASDTFQFSLPGRTTLISFALAAPPVVGLVAGYLSGGNISAGWLGGLGVATSVGLTPVLTEVRPARGLLGGAVALLGFSLVLGLIAFAGYGANHIARELLAVRASQLEKAKNAAAGHVPSSRPNNAPTKADSEDEAVSGEKRVPSADMEGTASENMPSTQPPRD